MRVGVGGWGGEGVGRGVGGRCKGVSRSNASVRWCVGLFPPCSTLCIVNMAAASASEALLLALLLPASLLCSNVFWSDGPRPGPQTDIHMCLYGPWDVICAWSGLSHWPRRSPACWAKSKR